MLAVVGVLIGENKPTAERFLANFGDFDEVVIGRGWLNSAAVSLMWRDAPGEASVPQLVIISRHIGLNNSQLLISPDRLLVRLHGSDNILRWLAAGRPLVDVHG
jgi:hypothetical protein